MALLCQAILKLMVKNKMSSLCNGKNIKLDICHVQSFTNWKLERQRSKLYDPEKFV